MLLIASPWFTVLLTVQAIISFSARQQPACGLLFPVANGEPQAQRGGSGESCGSPPQRACALTLPSLSLLRTPVLRQGARRARPLLWHFWSITSALEAYKSTCVRHSHVQINFKFTRNNYHLQITACTQGAWGGGREEKDKEGREVGTPG